jgi:hypothetical protein
VATATPLNENPQLLNRLLDSVRGGATFQAAGKEVGISGKHAADLCRKHGVDRVSPRNAVLSDPDALISIEASIKAGVSYAALAARYGVSPNAMGVIAYSIGFRTGRKRTQRVIVPTGARCNSLRCTGEDVKTVSGRYHIPVVCETCKVTKLVSKRNFMSGAAGCADCRKTFNGNCEGPIEQMYRRAKRRAAERGVKFSIEVSDIHIPKLCPVFGTPLYKGTASDKDNSPSLDRIDPSLGYEPGNVWVISYRANRIKNNATLTELKSLVAAIELL